MDGTCSPAGGMTLRSTTGRYSGISPSIGGERRCIRSGPWKLIRFYEGHYHKHYHLKDDISETGDLVDVYPDKVAELDHKLDNWLTSVNARLPEPNPKYYP